MHRLRRQFPSEIDRCSLFIGFNSGRSPGPTLATLLGILEYELAE